MIIGQFFDGNPNFVVSEMQEAILKAQVYHKNNILNILQQLEYKWIFDPSLHS